MMKEMFQTSYVKEYSKRPFGLFLCYNTPYIGDVMEMLGYKILDIEGKNRYGKIFLPGETYTVLGKLCFGTNGNGYHFCKHFEDCLKYLETFTRQFQLAEVKASGEILESFDRYNGVFDVYVASSLEVLRYLKKEEIFEKGLQLSSIQVKRFLQLYPLTEEEKEIFKHLYTPLELGVMQTFDYYQMDKKDAFSNVDTYLEKKENGMVYMKKWR